MRRTLALAVTALLLASLIPVVDAHAAPPPRAFETRVMHDHNDDSVFLTAQGKHGFDAIALDVREGFDLDAGPVLILRLVLNGGCNTNPNAPATCPELSHVVKFKADGADQAVTFRTPDGGATWTGSAPRFEGPFDLSDGTRFAIEAWVPMASIGTTVGSKLTDWFVEGYAGTETADNMPEGAVAGYDDPLGEAFVLESYTVKAPDYYLSMEAGPSMLNGKAGDEVRWGFNVTNLLADTQSITFSTVGLPASVVRGEPLVSEDMAPSVTRSYEVVLTPATSGTVTVIATTAFGGATAVAFQIMVPKADTGLNVMGPDVPAGGNFSHTFGQMGTVAYHDHHNAAVGGTIIVEAAGASKKTHTIHYDGTAFTPAELTIGMGDTVVWQNDGSAAMMVMGSGSADGHQDHDDHDHHHDDEPKEAPGAPLVLLAIGLLVAVVVARRR